MNTPTIKPKKLTPQQIEQIHGFVKKHYVEYYDVELELVDHLAQGIESQWEEDECVSFDNALQREFKKFGVFGFMDVVGERQSALCSYYYKMTFNEIGKFFTLPKLLLSLSIFSLLYLLGSKFFYTKLYIYPIIFFGVSVYIIIDAVIHNRKFKKIEKNSDKNWLIYGVGKQFYVTPLGIAFCASLPSLTNSFSWVTKYSSSNLTIILISSLIITLLILLIIVNNLVIRPLIENQIAEISKKHRFI